MYMFSVIVVSGNVNLEKKFVSKFGKHCLNKAFIVRYHTVYMNIQTDYTILSNLLEDIKRKPGLLEWASHVTDP